MGVNVGTSDPMNLVPNKTSLTSFPNAVWPAYGPDQSGRKNLRYGGQHSSFTPPPGEKFKGKWWTDERIKHAYDRLIEGGMTPLAAEARIARWAYVEAPNGPTSSNNLGGGHVGISQWDRARWSHIKGAGGFDDQIDLALEEDKTSERKARQAMDAATNAREAAQAIGMNERAGPDEPAATAKTERAIPKIHSIIINKNTGGNPITSSAAVAAPP